MDFKPGNYVVISVKHQFRAPKIAVVIGSCKDGHPLVRVLDEKIITKEACVDPERGDTIVKLTKTKP